MKRIIKLCFGVFCYYSGIDALFYWLNRSAKRVVTFHNVIPDGLCVGMPRIPVAIPESMFRMQVAEILKHFVVNTDLTEDGTLTITFDDGYLNQYEVAGRVLGEFGIPAVVFVTDEVLNARGLGSALWPDKAEHSGMKIGKEYERLRLSGMSLQNLEELRDRGWRIGYHTKAHRRLSELDMAGKSDALQPPDWFKRLCGDQMVISYPFGQVKDVDDESERLAEELGYERAYSNQCELDPRIGHRYFLPRIAPFPGKYWLHLDLSGAKYFFKYFRLLPKHVARLSQHNKEAYAC